MDLYNHLKAILNMRYLQGYILFGGCVHAFVQPSVEERGRVLLKTQNQLHMEALSLRWPCLHRAYSYRGTDSIYARGYFKINAKVL